MALSRNQQKAAFFQAQIEAGLKKGLTKAQAVSAANQAVQAKFFPKPGKRGAALLQGKRRVHAGFGRLTGDVVGSEGEAFLRGERQLSRLPESTVRQLERRFKQRNNRNDPRFKQIQQRIREFDAVKVQVGALRQQRLARAQSAVDKDTLARQSTQPDRFDKIIADTKQRDKVRQDIIGAGFDPANLQRATPRFVDKITTNEAQREQARFQAGIPISQRPAKITGGGRTPSRQEKKITLNESLSISDRSKQTGFDLLPQGPALLSGSRLFKSGLPGITLPIERLPFVSIKQQVQRFKGKERDEGFVSFEPTNPLLQPVGGAKSVFQEFVNIGEGLGQVVQGKEVRPSTRVNTIFGDFISSGAKAFEDSSTFGIPPDVTLSVEFERFKKRTIKKVQERPLQVGGEFVGEFATGFGLGSVGAKVASKIIPFAAKTSTKTGGTVIDDLAQGKTKTFSPNIKFRKVPKDVFADDLARADPFRFGTRHVKLGRGLGRPPRFDAGDVNRVLFGPSKPTKGGGTFSKPIFKTPKGQPRTTQELLQLTKKKKITKATSSFDFKVTEFGKSGRVTAKQSSKLDNLFAKPKQQKKKTRDDLLLEQLAFPGKVRTKTVTRARQKFQDPLKLTPLFKQPTRQDTKLTPLLKQPNKVTTKLDTPFKPPRQPQRTLLKQPTRTPTRLDTPFPRPPRNPLRLAVLFPNLFPGGGRRGDSKRGLRRGDRTFQTLGVDPLRPGVILAAPSRKSKSPKIFGELDIALEKERRKPGRTETILGDFGRPTKRKGKKRKSSSPLDNPFGF